MSVLLLRNEYACQIMVPMANVKGLEQTYRILFQNSGLPENEQI